MCCLFMRRFRPLNTYDAVRLCAGWTRGHGLCNSLPARVLLDTDGAFMLLITPASLRHRMWATRVRLWDSKNQKSFAPVARVRKNNVDTLSLSGARRKPACAAQALDSGDGT